MIETIPGRTTGPVAPAVCCHVAAHASVEAQAAELPTFRQQLAQMWAGTLSVPLFRQADDQTILGLAALSRALEAADLRADSFTEWGVLGAPRFFGRAAHAASLERSKADGPWGVSPHFVPHRSLHSLPGMVSLALRARGPNLGVGGGPGGETEALLTAATLLQGGHLPGVWVIFTGFDPEPVPTPQGEIPGDSVCRAAALALTPAQPGPSAFRLRVSRHRPDSARVGGRLTLEALAAALANPVEYRTTWLWHQEHCVVEIDRPGAGGELRP